MNNYDSKLICKIIKYSKKFLNESLFNHILSVAAQAAQIAVILNRFDLVNNCILAGILHDISKHLNLEQMQELVSKYELKINKNTLNNIGLLHGHISALIAKIKFNIKDNQVLSAIKNHTLGKVKMNTLDKILFISDYIEPLRKFENINEIRCEVFKHIFNDNLDNALLTIVQSKIKSLKKFKININEKILKIEKTLNKKNK